MVGADWKVDVNRGIASWQPFDGFDKLEESFSSDVAHVEIIVSKELKLTGATQGKLDRFVEGKLANMYAEIGDVYLSSGMYPEAIHEYRRALVLGPAFVDIRARLAGALRDSGEREAAIAELEEVVRQTPNYLPARLNLGLSLYAADRKDEAARHWRFVLEVSPGNRNAELYLQLSGILAPAA